MPAVVVQGYLDFMKDWLIGQNALEIQKCYANMTRMRAQWHAHWTQNPTVSGIDMALWDIAGKVLNCSVSRLHHRPVPRSDPALRERQRARRTAWTRSAAGTGRKR